MRGIGEQLQEDAIAEQRRALVAAAHRWVGTPYRLGAMVRGVGCDCATLLVGVLQDCGLWTEEKVGRFSMDWWAHAKADTYLLRVLRNSAKMAEATCFSTVKTEPGNIVLTRAAKSKVYNHGGIVTAWPLGIHAVSPKVRPVNFSLDPMWAGQKVVIFDPFPNDERSNQHE